MLRANDSIRVCPRLRMRCWAAFFIKAVRGQVICPHGILYCGGNRARAASKELSQWEELGGQEAGAIERVTANSVESQPGAGTVPTYRISAKPEVQ